MDGFHYPPSSIHSPADEQGFERWELTDTDFSLSAERTTLASQQTGDEQVFSQTTMETRI